MEKLVQVWAHYEGQPHLHVTGYSNLPNFMRGLVQKYTSSPNHLIFAEVFTMDGEAWFHIKTNGGDDLKWLDAEISYSLS